MLVPKIHFKRDDGTEYPSWEEVKLEDVVDFLDGLRKPIETSKRVAGPYPYYGASGITDYVADYIFDEDLILLKEDGVNIFDRNSRVCFMARGKYWVNNHAHVLRANSDCVSEYICEYLEKLDYRKMNSGTAQAKLNQQTCRNIRIKKPCLEEQQKIAAFLSDLEEIISASEAEVTALELQKKGIMQKIFSQEVRFKQDDGTDYPMWMSGKLGDITEKVERKAPKGSLAPVMMVSQGKGFIYQSDKYSRGNAGESLKKYTLLKQGEFAYNHGASKAKPYGVAYCLEAEPEARIPFVYHTFRIVNGINSYWHIALNTNLADRQLKRMVSSGVRMDGLLNINYENYMDVNIDIPSLEEQQKIADFLSDFDSAIDLAKQEFAKWKLLKKGLMQQMFV